MLIMGAELYLRPFYYLVLPRLNAVEVVGIYLLFCA